jgi:hypothetical protein
VAGARSFLATHNEAPLAVAAFGDPFQRLITPVLESEGREIDDPEGYLAGLHLLNVGKACALARDPTQPTGWAVTGWTFPKFGPVVVSSRAVGWSYPDSAFGTPGADARLLEMVREMGVSHAGVCRRILLADPTADQDLGGFPSVAVLSHRVWNQRVELRLRVSDPCFARLAYAYYPHLRVSVDGRTAPAMPTAGRFIAVKLDAGEHTLVLEPRLSPLRKALLGLNLLLLAAGAFVLIRQRSRRAAA